MPTNTTKLDWTPSKFLATKIEFVMLIMSDVETEDELGQQLHKILECYMFMLIRTKHRFTTDPSEREDMITTIHFLDELFHQILEQPEAKGWYFGIQADNNIAYSLANLLIQVRNELLIAIAIRH